MFPAKQSSPPPKMKSAFRLRVQRTRRTRTPQIRKPRRREPVPGLRKLLEDKPVFKHAVIRSLHVVSSEEGTHFWCGRRISTSYQEYRKLPKILFPVCKQRCPDA